MCRMIFLVALWYLFTTNTIYLLDVYFMKRFAPGARIWIKAAILFIFSFVLITYLFIERDKKASKAKFSRHAAVLAIDVWALDTSGVDAYLQLAVDASHYKKLAVVLPDHEHFAGVVNSSPNQLDSLLNRAGLIGTRSLSSDITYEGRKIGTLKGEQYVRVIFPLVNILILLLLICLIFVFMSYLLLHRRQLEKTVAERTKSLSASETRFHNLVNLLPEMIWEADKHGNISYANKAAIDRFTLNNYEHNNLRWFDLIVEDQRMLARQNFENCLKGREEGLQEFDAIDKDGQKFPILVRSSVIKNDKEIYGARTIVIDIGDRRNLENELNRAKKMKAIGMMAGGVAHDLNNLLSGVVSYPELILMQLPDDSELRQPIQAIRESGLQAAEVVSDLLTVARGIAASKQVHDVNTLISSYLTSPDFKRLEEIFPQISFSVSLNPTTSNITCSAIHFKKSLMNLVANSAEAIGPDSPGQVNISSGTAVSSNPTIEDATVTQQNYTIVKVKDTGMGLSKKDVEHIFEPFYTKKKMGRSGTGLGLTIVWNTMIDHDGWVEVDSRQGQTVFTLYFPSTEQKPSESQEKFDWLSLRGKKQTVLVIDDDARQRDIATKLLQTLNYRVTCCSSGEEAISYLKENAVDILLLDMLMDPGINGLETYKHIVKIHPRQRAVIASGYSKSMEVQETLKLGASSYISKPYTLEQLAQAMSSALACN